MSTRKHVLIPLKYQEVLASDKKTSTYEKCWAFFSSSAKFTLVKSLHLSLSWSSNCSGSRCTSVTTSSSPALRHSCFWGPVPKEGSSATDHYKTHAIRPSANLVFSQLFSSWRDLCFSFNFDCFEGRGGLIGRSSFITLWLMFFMVLLCR